MENEFRRNAILRALLGIGPEMPPPQMNQQPQQFQQDMSSPNVTGPSGMQYNPQNTFQQDYARNSIFMYPLRMFSGQR